MPGSRIGRFSFAAIGLVLFALAGCSSAPRPAERDIGASARDIGASARDIGASAAQHALSLQGKPYRYGGNTPQGFDCSGLVQYSYTRAGARLPRSTEGQWAGSRSVSSREIRPGDLLFFHEEGRRNSHVALYIGNNRFVHSPSSGKRVSTASLSDPYWRQNFSAARRPVL
jgi:cell wall-associated NlpC family hydrolase